MIKTEQRNPSSTHIYRMTSMEMCEVMQAANIEAANAVSLAKNEIAQTVDEISKRMNKGGRLFYVGCGTSGRLGVLDASECPPTYGVSPELVVGVIAGGDKALRHAIENAEDNFEAGQHDLQAYNVGENDSVVGISVAGNAAYVDGAVKYANSVKALTVGLTCNANSLLAKHAQILIVTDTGPEVVTGSTRMKAGNAHKMVLNMLSTGVMIKLGRVYENYMVYVKPTNIKLKDRMIRMTCELAACSADTAESLLENNDWDIKKAVEAFKQA